MSAWVGGWVVIRWKIMLLRDPTCKISSRVEIPMLDPDVALLINYNDRKEPHNG